MVCFTSLIITKIVKIIIISTMQLKLHMRQLLSFRGNELYCGYNNFLYTFTVVIMK